MMANNSKTTNLVRLLSASHSGLTDRLIFERTVFSNLLVSFKCEPSQDIAVDSTVNCIDVDSSQKFLAVGDCEGKMLLQKVVDETNGCLSQLAVRQYSKITTHRCQWYPNDTGLIAVTYPNKLCLIDTNNLLAIDSFSFSPSKAFWSDWNTGRTHLIAVATSPSVRFVDIRCGDALQSITVPSLLGQQLLSVTRVFWTPLDDDCIIVGDSSGFLHIFDIRSPRKSVQAVHTENSVCEPVVCLTSTNNKMSFITSHGLNNRLNQWRFKNGKLVNSNVNYPCPFSRFKTKFKVDLSKAYLKCQVYVTEDYIFSPTPEGCGEIAIYNLSTGENLGILTPSTYNPVNTGCVNGLDKQLILYSGSRRCIRTWSPKMKSDEEEENLKKFYEDNWSDSD